MLKMKVVPTYKSIIEYSKKNYPDLRVIQTCWIAETKEKMGLPIRKANNRTNNCSRKRVCPKEILPHIRMVIEVLMQNK